MDTRYAVRLVEGIDAAQRPAVAASIAPRFGIDSAKIERLLSRGPGFMTRQTSWPEAKRVADVFEAAGAVVELVPAAEQSAPHGVGPYSQSGRSVGGGVADLHRSGLDRGPEVTAVVEAAPGRAADDAGMGPLPADHAERPAPTVTPERQQPSRGGPQEPNEQGDAVLWAEAAAASDTALGDRAELSASEGVSSEAHKAGATEGNTPRLRLSLRWKLLLAVLVPTILMASAAAYVAHRAVAEAGTLSVSRIGDNVAQMLAADVSTFMTENALDFENAEDLQLIELYFGHRVGAFGPGLHDTVGIHLTDAVGTTVAGHWQTQDQGAALPPVEESFQASAVAALTHSEFGAEEPDAATLAARTTVVEPYQVVAAPLINGVGTVQVVLRDNSTVSPIAAFSLPVLITAAAALLAATLASALVAFRYANSCRRLAGAADRIAFGELDGPVEVRGNDETRDVAEALERLRVSLRSAMKRKGRV